jgi:hypothetical protein
MIGAERLRTNGFLVVIAVAALRTMVALEPQVWFADLDPAIDAMPLLAVGLRGSLQFDLLMLGGALAALVGEHRSGRGIDPWMSLLALLPMPVILYHAIGPVPGDAFRGATWLASMVGFVAVAHVVREARMRVIALSVLLGAFAILVTRGAVQLLVEHAATVAEYQRTRSEFLALRGWAPDSSAALTYERRLMQPEATGWFGLSNPFSTLMGVGAVALAAIGLTARRAQQSGNTGLLLLASAACAVLLVVNAGKGAIAATILASAVVASHLLWRRVPRGWVLAVLCGVALAAIAARGAVDAVVGDRFGERSLLFRWYYLEAGARIFADGLHALLGVGPDRVQDAFVSAKPAQCPEDVKSLHSMAADWLVALGIIAAAWIGVVVRAFRSRAADPSDEASLDDAAAASARQTAFVAALSIGVASLLIQLAVETPTVDVVWFMFRALGVVLCAFVATVAAGALALVPTRTVRTIAFAAAALVLVHAQIEMVLWAPGTCAVGLVLVATGSTLRDRRPLSPRAVLATGVLAMMTVAALIFLEWRAVVHDGRLASAARLLTPIAVARTTAESTAPEFTAREQSAREEAARILLTADRAASTATIDAAARQLIRLAFIDPQRAEGHLADAWSIVQRRESRDLLRGLRADIAMLRMRMSRLDASQTLQALAAIEAAALAAPHNPRRRLEFAVAADAACQRIDVVEAAPDLRGRALSAYRDALAISERLALDPLAPLPERERIRAENAILRLEGAGGT